MTMTIGNRVLMLAPGILLTPTALAGSSRRRPAGSRRPRRFFRTAKRPLEATKQYTIQQKEAFEKTVQDELNELHSKDRGATEKDSARPLLEARKDLQKAIQDLEKKKDEARRKFEEVTESTSSAWRLLKDGMTAAVEDLKKSYREAVSKLP